VNGEAEDKQKGKQHRVDYEPPLQLEIAVAIAILASSAVTPLGGLGDVDIHVELERLL
jgi:hypothetical protein